MSQPNRVSEAAEKIRAGGRISMSITRQSSTILLCFEDGGTSELTEREMSEAPLEDFRIVEEAVHRAYEKGGIAA